MLKQEDKDKLKSFGFDVDKLEAAFKAETETEITIPVGTFMDDASLTARDNNKISEGKTLGITEGKTAGFEIANKTIIEKFSLKDVKKSDDPTKIVEALHAQMGKGDEGLQGQINELLKDKTTLEATVQTLEGEKKSIEQNTSLLGMLPKGRSSLLFDNEYLSTVKQYIVDVDGVPAVKLDGVILRDGKTQALLPIQDGINKIFESRKGWLEVEGTPGRGGGNTPGAGSAIGTKTLSSFNEAYIKEHGEGSMLSDEYRQAVVEAAKPGSGFDMDK